MTLKWGIWGHIRNETGPKREAKKLERSTNCLERSEMLRLETVLPIASSETRGYEDETSQPIASSEARGYEEERCP